MKKISMMGLIALLPVLAFAHPGHGDTGGYTIIHYFVELPHALIMWPVVIAIAIHFRYLYRRELKEESVKKAEDYARTFDRNGDH